MPPPINRSNTTHSKSVDQQQTPSSELIDLTRSFIDRYAPLGLAVTKAGGSAALGMMLTGPVGAVLAPVAVTFLTDHCGKSLLDYFKRNHSEREKIRAADALVAAIRESERRLEQGEAPRTDWILTDGDQEWSGAESLLDGMLRSAEAAYEEKKTYYIGCLYSSFLFHHNITSESANLLLYMARHLTYSQFVLLAVFGCSQLPGAILDQKSTSPETLSLIAQILDLTQKQLIDHDYGQDIWLGGPTVLANNKLSGLGNVLFHSMRLEQLKERDQASYESALTKLHNAELQTAR